MGIDDKSALYEEYVKFHKAAKQAEKAGELDKAKDFYTSASEVLYEFATSRTGEYRQAYMSQVDMLIDKAKSLKSGSSKSPDSGTAASVKKVDDDETQFFVATIPDVTFDDVAGLDSVKRAIDDRIVKPREYPEVYKAFNIKPGGGVLMYGPPGTGKTMIAKAIANKVGAALYDVKCSQIVQKYFGVAERNIKNLFESARAHEVAVIYFDEFDSLGAKRGSDSTVMNRLVPELLGQMDGFTGSFNTLMVIASTNRPWDIDSAFLRPGRFSELLYIDLPDVNARAHIITKSFGDIPLQEGIDIDALARQMEKFNGADVAEFCDRCKRRAANFCISQYKGDITKRLISLLDVEETLKNMTNSVHQEDIDKLESFKKQFHKF